MPAIGPIKRRDAEFGFCDADRRHILHDSVSACELSASGWPTVRDIGDTAHARRWMVFYLEHRTEPDPKADAIYRRLLATP
jgi:hypothetical protein